MRKITLITAIAMIAFTANSFAQDASGTVGTTANVITPIAIEGGDPLNFGDVVGTVAGGTVTISADGATRNASVADLLIGQAATFSAATFTVTGEAGYGFEITLPPAFDVSTVGDTPAIMNVGAFTSTPDALGTLTEGTATVTVGATLTVGPNQASGAYASADGMTVTVQYN